MAKTRKTTDITEAEIVEVVQADDVTTLITEDVVHNTLRKFSVTDAKIEQMKADYGSLRILGPDDKENYKTVAAALTEVRNLRYFVENRRKELKRPVIDMGNAIEAEAKRLTNGITPIENHLKAEVDRTEREIEERKRVEERRRIQALNAVGFQMVGQSYVLGHAGDFFDNIMAMSFDEFEDLLSAGRLEADRLEKERIGQQEEAAKLAAQQEELEAFRRWKAEQEAAAAPQPQPQPQPVSVESDPFFAPPQPAPKAAPVDIWDAPQNVQAYPNSNPTAKPLSETQMWYNNGFEAAKRAMMEILNSPDKFTRAELKERINNLKP